MQAFRVVSLAYDAQVCGFWVAEEGPDLTLLSPGGEVILRVETDMPQVRSLTVDGGGHVHFAADTSALPGIMGELASHGIRTITATPPTLEQLLLRHYGDAS